MCTDFYRLRSRGLERCGFDRLRDGAKFSGNRARLFFAVHLLIILFGKNQDSALAHYIRGSMILRYNNTKRASEARK